VRHRRGPTLTLSRFQSLRSRTLKPSPNGRGSTRLGPRLLRRSRGVGGGDQMPLPAGRRQELAGLFLARARLGDQGGVAQGLERGFAVEDRVHFGLISSRSRHDLSLSRWERA
jgi:hypothetical protein